MSEEKLEPEIRFKNFYNSWEEFKFKDVTSAIGDGLHGTPNYSSDGDIPFINGNNLKNGKIIVTEDTKSVNEEERFHYDKALNKETILLSINGTIGNLAFYNNQKIMLGKSVAYLNLININKVFMYFLLQTNKLQKYFTNNLTGSTIKNLGLKTISETKSYKPTIIEQKLIGKYFHTLDQNIQAKQAELKKLKQFKQAMLQKMFPKEGETVPEIRFEGFEGEWIFKTLKEIGQLYQPETISRQDLTNSGYRVFGANGYIGYYDKFNHKFDQVSISARGENAGNVNYIEGPSWITGNSMVINVDDSNNINKRFLYSMLSAYPFEKFITGGAQPQLTRSVLYNVGVVLPCIEEQRVIGTYFNQLDTSIQSKQAELDKLKQFKQAMLDKMFV